MNEQRSVFSGPYYIGSLIAQKYIFSTKPHSPVDALEICADQHDTGWVFRFHRSEVYWLHEEIKDLIGPFTREYLIAQYFGDFL